MLSKGFQYSNLDLSKTKDFLNYIISVTASATYNIYWHISKYFFPSKKSMPYLIHSNQVFHYDPLRSSLRNLPIVSYSTGCSYLDDAVFNLKDINTTSQADPLVSISGKNIWLTSVNSSSVSLPRKCLNPSPTSVRK